MHKDGTEATRLRRRRKPRHLYVFFIVLCLLSTFADVLIIHNQHETAALSRFLMWCPGSAAIITCWFFSIPIGSLGWRWPARPYMTLAYFLPLLYATPVYLLTWIMIRGSLSLKPFESTVASQYGLAKWPLLGTFGVSLPQIFSIYIIATVTWTLGEELGWRGFLFPCLYAKSGFHGACLISGFIWAVWHYPSMLGADYNAGTNPAFAIACFTVGVVAMSYLMGHLRLRSASLWHCVLLHATHNTFVEGLFDPLTVPTGSAKHFTTEFGIGMAFSLIVTAVIVVRQTGVAATRVVA